MQKQVEMGVLETRQCCHLHSGGFPSLPNQFVSLISRLKKIMDLLTAENEDVTLFRNVGRPVPKDAVPRLARLESSTTPLSEI